MTPTKSKQQCSPHQFWKDRNPPECLNCGKTVEQLQGKQLRNLILDRLSNQIERKSVEELKYRMGEAYYGDLSVQVAYKEGYNRAVDEHLSLLQQAKEANP